MDEQRSKKRKINQKYHDTPTLDFNQRSKRGWPYNYLIIKRFLSYSLCHSKQDVIFSVYIGSTNYLTLMVHTIDEYIQGWLTFLACYTFLYIATLVVSYNFSLKHTYSHIAIGKLVWLKVFFSFLSYIYSLLLGITYFRS